MNLKLDWCGQDAARFAVKRWHYSGSMPPTSVSIGVWESGVFKGAVLFGRGAASEIGSPFGLEQTKICELTRIALREHETPVSKILSIALRMLKHQSPGLRLIVSFADTSRGHHGGIYQAANWIYLGSENYHAYRVRGAVIHPKTLHSRYGIGGQSIPWLRKHVDPKAERINAGIKHKYALPLDDKMRMQIEHLAQPYPKRGKQAMAGDQPAQRQGSTDRHAPIKVATLDGTGEDFATVAAART